MSKNNRKSREEIQSEAEARAKVEAKAKQEAAEAAKSIDQARLDKEAADAQVIADSITESDAQATAGSTTGSEEQEGNSVSEAPTESSRLGKFLVDAVGKFVHEMEHGSVGSIKKKKESLLSTIGFVFKQDELTQADVDPLMEEFKNNVYFSERNLMIHLSPAYMSMVSYIHGKLDGANVTIECPFGTPLNANKIK